MVFPKMGDPQVTMASILNYAKKIWDLGYPYLRKSPYDE